MAYIIDEIDWKIISLLQADGRSTNVEIARQVGVTEGTVRNRIDRLLVEGVIKIYAAVKPEKIGFQTRVIIGVHAQWDKVTEIAKRLTTMPEVRSVISTLGPYNLIVEALFSSNNELGPFFTRDIAAIPGIKQVDTFHVLESIKDGCDWRLPMGARREKVVEQRYRILLVDDDPLFVKATQLVLESAGYEVATAKSGDEALTLMRAERPDLVVLDIMMDTILDGVYVSRTMWGDDKLRKIPVVMVSSIASSEYASQFPLDEYLNAVDFLFKPIQPSDLLESIQRFLK